MKCVICKHGETAIGKSFATLNRDGKIIVFKNVPAEICNNCGEIYFGEETADNLMVTAEKACKEAGQVEVLEFQAA